MRRPQTPDLAFARQDLSPGYRRESTVSDRKLLKLRNADGYLKRFQ
jgi:hypothetical protein